ncbi:MAG: hypothetical protein MK108_03255 [Mariniblastus sp.]|nr:hypothetical protein [Mariniblastus sp.]
MTQRTHTPELTSAKPRCGLQSAASLLPRLIAFYECQAAARQHLETDSLPSLGGNRSRGQQATFAFYR